MRNATFCDILHELKTKQTLESAQYGLEISFKQILNSKPSKRNKSTSFYRSRSLLVASLSGGVYVHVHVGCFDLCKH